MKEVRQINDMAALPVSSPAPDASAPAASAPTPTPSSAKTLSERYTFFPIVERKAYEFYKQHCSTIWMPEEVDLSQDLRDLARMRPQEREFIEMILAFFAGLDGIVMEDATAQSEDVSKEQKAFLSIKAFMECVHSETYSLLIDTLVTDVKRKDHLLSSLDTMPSVKALADWSLKWLSPSVSRAFRLLAGVIIEGVFFSGAFCAIFWLKRNGILPGLTFSNELISRDEGLHCLFGIYQLSLLPKQDEKAVHALFREAMAVAEAFYSDAIRVDLIGLDAKQMTQYVQYVADDRLQLLGYSKLYNVQQPFEFMKMLSLEGKTNFFEKRVGEYSKTTTTKNGVNPGRAVTAVTAEIDF